MFKSFNSWQNFSPSLAYYTVCIVNYDVQELMHLVFVYKCYYRLQTETFAISLTAHCKCTHDETWCWHTDVQILEMKGASLLFTHPPLFLTHAENTHRSCCVPLGFDEIRLGCDCTDWGAKVSSVMCQSSELLYNRAAACVCVRVRLKRWGNRGRSSLTMQPFTDTFQ